jgi:hypothetical protein
MRRFERLDVHAQPTAVTHRHPDGGARPGLGLHGKVQGVGVIEQPVFQQTLQHGTQTG